jgi:hypothetical protein
MPAKFWLRSTKERRPFKKHKCKWEYNTKLDLREMEWKAADWTNSSQGREKWRAVLSTVMSLRFS